ncbi:MAG TPA: tRNA (guanosine(46)-N7)-methyltransferase TrmB [Candidatus Saccharimonadales bacterium]|nr:tRNA (guanosine(46)-N7)-methyltransferase TrmB [Candidatus Saccharimonadales bacterium]
MILDPQDFIITRKRKKYKFALFHNSSLCFEFDERTQLDPFKVLEVGAGTGLFSVALAATSDKRFLAVDVKADRLQKGAGKAAAEGLNNIQFLRARVDQLDEFVLPHSLETIWVTFPDPFPRGRSAKRRLTHANFLALYEKWLAPGGTVCFKTDARSLFEWSLEEFVRNGWRIEELSFDLHGSSLSREYIHKTTYEDRYIREGKPIGFVKALPPTR